MTTAPPRQKRSRKKYAQVSAPAEAVALTPPTPLPDTSGRVAIEALEPEIDGGLFAVKRVVGDEVSLSVDIFSDGHDEIAADIAAGGDFGAQHITGGDLQNPVAFLQAFGLRAFAGPGRAEQDQFHP